MAKVQGMRSTAERHTGGGPGTERSARITSLAVEALTAIAHAPDLGEAKLKAEEARWRLGRAAPMFEPLIASLLARVDQARALEELAATDPLTRVANRRGFEDVLERELARRNREGGAVAVILFDLDELKAINDAVGHAAGDEAIRALARVCEETVRVSDIVARIGGDELAVLLPRAEAVQASQVAARIRDRVESIAVAGRPLRVSYGVADTNGIPDEVPAPSAALLAAADDALYRDKRSRRGLGRRLFGRR